MENQWQPMETAPKDGSKFLMYITGFEYKKIMRMINIEEKKLKKYVLQTMFLIAIVFLLAMAMVCGRLTHCILREKMIVNCLGVFIV